MSQERERLMWIANQRHAVEPDRLIALVQQVKRDAEERGIEVELLPNDVWNLSIVVRAEDDSLVPVGVIDLGGAEKDVSWYGEP